MGCATVHSSLEISRSIKPGTVKPVIYGCTGVHILAGFTLGESPVFAAFTPYTRAELKGRTNVFKLHVANTTNDSFVD